MFNWLKKVGRYLHRDAVALDQTLNVFAGGKNDETISSRAQRAADHGNLIGTALSAGLDLIQSDHGHRAIGGDLRRAQDVVETEQQALDGRK